MNTATTISAARPPNILRSTYGRVSNSRGADNAQTNAGHMVFAPTMRTPLLVTRNETMPTLQTHTHTHTHTHHTTCSPLNAPKKAKLVKSGERSFELECVELALMPWQRCTSKQRTREARRTPRHLHTCCVEVQPPKIRPRNNRQERHSPNIGLDSDSTSCGCISQRHNPRGPTKQQQHTDCMRAKDEQRKRSSGPKHLPEWEHTSHTRTTTKALRLYQHNWADGVRGEQQATSYNSTLH